MSYQSKYIKYKNKYINLQNILNSQKGGNDNYKILLITINPLLCFLLQNTINNECMIICEAPNISPTQINEYINIDNNILYITHNNNTIVGTTLQFDFINITQNSNIEYKHIINNTNCQNKQLELPYTSKPFISLISKFTEYITVSTTSMQDIIVYLCSIYKPFIKITNSSWIIFNKSDIILSKINEQLFIEDDIKYIINDTNIHNNNLTFIIEELKTKKVFNIYEVIQCSSNLNVLNTLINSDNEYIYKYNIINNDLIKNITHIKYNKKINNQKNLTINKFIKFENIYNMITYFIQENKLNHYIQQSKLLKVDKLGETKLSTKFESLDKDKVNFISYFKKYMYQLKNALDYLHTQHICYNESFFDNIHVSDNDNIQLYYFDKSFYINKFDKYDTHKYIQSRGDLYNHLYTFTYRIPTILKFIYGISMIGFDNTFVHTDLFINRLILFDYKLNINNSYQKYKLIEENIYQIDYINLGCDIIYLFKQLKYIEPDEDDKSQSTLKIDKLHSVPFIMKLTDTIKCDFDIDLLNKMELSDTDTIVKTIPLISDLFVKKFNEIYGVNLIKL